MVKRVRVSSFAGKGALVQAIGLMAPLVLWWLLGGAGAAIGLIVAMVLFVKGSSMAISWRCGSCGNPLHDKKVRMCPVCKADAE